MKPVLTQSTGTTQLRQASGRVQLRQRSGLVTFSTRAGVATPPIVYQLDFSKDYNSQYINIIF